MKAPKLQTFPEKKPSASFEGRASQAKKSAEEMQRKTFTMTADDLAKIQQVALEMGKQRGKVVSASEALRSIIAAYEVV